MIFKAFQNPNVREALWFVEYNVTRSPKPIVEVLNETFIQMFLVSVAVFISFFLVKKD
jgi:hypothetical protein